LHDLICIAVALFSERMLATQVIFLCIALFTRTAKMDPFLEQNGQTDWNVLSFLKDGEERIGLFVQTRLNSL
jgi:hypothetical protein